MGGGGGDGKPVQPLSASAASALLREEISLAEKTLRFRHVPKAPGETEEPRNVLNMRMTYSISTPFPVLSQDVLRTRKEAAAAKASGAASGDADGSPSGASGSGSGASASSEKDRSLGSFCQVLLFDGPACLRELLKAGGQADCMDLVQATPIHKATANGDARAIQLLIGAGCNIDDTTKLNQTCIYV